MNDIDRIAKKVLNWMPNWARWLLVVAFLGLTVLMEWFMWTNPAMPEHWASLKRFSSTNTDVGGTIATIFGGYMLSALYVLPLGYAWVAWYVMPWRMRKRAKYGNHDQIEKHHPKVTFDRNSKRM